MPLNNCGRTAGKLPSGPAVELPAAVRGPGSQQCALPSHAENHGQGQGPEQGRHHPGPRAVGAALVGQPGALARQMATTNPAPASGPSGSSLGMDNLSRLRAHVAPGAGEDIADAIAEKDHPTNGPQGEKDY